MAEKRYFSSESVTEGHPDKVCDKISDSVLDAIFAQDPMARVACETCTTTGMVLLTDDGDYAHRMLAPKKHVPKRKAYSRN